MRVHFLPTLKDNYSYVVVDDARRTALLIDPAEAPPVLSFLDEHGLKVEAIWITHHHSDHTGGIDGILRIHRGAPVICSERDKDRVPCITRTVKEGDRLEFAGQVATVLEVPGHAEGHIAYHFPQSHHLFAGDVIFGASCGAVPTGDYADMHRSVTRLGRLSPQTQIWCGHEYTGNNLRWAEVVLGEEALKQRKASFKTPSIPLILETELATNPFLKLESPEVQAYAGETEPFKVFKALRLAKNQF